MSRDDWKNWLNRIASPALAAFGSGVVTFTVATYQVNGKLNEAITEVRHTVQTMNAIVVELRTSLDRTNARIESIDKGGTSFGLAELRRLNEADARFEKYVDRFDATVGKINDNLSKISNDVAALAARERASKGQ